MILLVIWSCGINLTFWSHVDWTWWLKPRLHYCYALAFAWCYHWRMESNHYCSSLVSPVAHIRLCDHCMTIAVCNCVTFWLANVVIENANASHAQGRSSVIPGNGAGSLATLTKVYWELVDWWMLHIRITRDALLPKMNANTCDKQYVNAPHMH